MDSPVPQFTMLYDGECPLCVREVRWLKKRDSKNSLQLIDITDAEFKAEEFGKTQDELMAKIHGVTSAGELVEGVEVFRQAYSAVGLGYLLSLTKYPVIRELSDLAYRGFAKIRIPLGRLLGRCDTSACER